MSKELDEKDIILIERFLDFGLSDPELEAFGKRMEEDAGFRQHVDDFEKANYISELVTEEKVLPKEIVSSLKGNKNYGLTKLLLILVVLFLTLYALYLYIPQPLDKEKVYADVESYTIQLSEDAMRGNQTGVTLPLSEIQRTIQKIKELDEKNSPLESVNQIEPMLHELEDVDAKEIVSWWLVKFYLENDNWDSAVKMLNMISDNDKYNSSHKARSILNKN